MDINNFLVEDILDSLRDYRDELQNNGDTELADQTQNRIDRLETLKLNQ